MLFGGAGLATSPSPGRAVTAHHIFTPASPGGRNLCAATGGTHDGPLTYPAGILTSNARVGRLSQPSRQPRAHSRRLFNRHHERRWYRAERVTHGAAAESRAIPGHGGHASR